MSHWDDAKQRGIYLMSGVRNNATDGEHDVIAVHLRTGESQRFHGTFYNAKFDEAVAAWIRRFPADEEMRAIVQRIDDARAGARAGQSA